jgi:hypothetical protein
MSEIKNLISTMSNKWKLEQIPVKKLELDNKIMEEKLNQLKSELKNDKQKRSVNGGTIWSRGHSGPVTNYARNVLSHNHQTGPASASTSTHHPTTDLNRMTNRQIKIKVLKEEALAVKQEQEKEKKSVMTIKDKRSKCGQCEKNTTFCHCLECCEDYCANCFTNFHMKGALRKHRTVPIGSSAKATYRPTSNTSVKSDSLRNSKFGYNFNNSKVNPDPKPNDSSLLNGHYDEYEAQESFKQAVLQWRNGPSGDNIIKDKPPISLRSNNKMENASSGTDRQEILNSHDQNKSDAMNNQLKNLENQIESNHSLSYGERILLMKYRRNDLDIKYSARQDRNESENKIEDDKVKNTDIIIEVSCLFVNTF